ncbi:restriction endonuclease subunit S [Aliarcobacter butzleri]|uniref:restriction endonuclease subunit S n=1 Tax=Aliarcobacter butzleri TaxID=28197 RepID=UPI0012F8EF52|nr:restriction endonuclease subunit S [Aliarcobacter butzleri]
MSDFLQSKELDFYVSAPICYGIVQTGEPQEEGVPAIEVKDIVDGKINEETIKKTTVAIDSEYKRSRLKTGDIVIAIRGTIGRVAIVPSSLNGANITRDVARIRVDDPDKRDYIYFYLTSKVAEDHLRDNNIGQAVKGINIKDLKKLPIFIPEDKNEIKKLNSIFKTASKQIEKQKHLIEAKEIQKKGLMQKLLTGKTRFKGFADKWRTVKLDEILYEPNKDKVENPNEYELLTVKLHCQGVVRSGKFPNVTEKGRPYYLVESGELLIGKQNFHNGGFGIVPKGIKNVVTSNAITHLKEKSDLCVLKFVEYYFSQYNFYKKIDYLTGGTGQKEISKKEFNSIKISLPSLQEQTKIVEVLSVADKEIKLLNKKLFEIEEEKKGLMQKLFTGEVRVNV